MTAVKKASNVFVWIILGLLIIALAGFGVTNFGGRVNDIGTVGDEPISVDAYASAIDNVLRRAQSGNDGPISLSEAQQRGLLGRARAQVISTAALDDEAARLGLSASDAMVRAELEGTQAFQGSDGAFDPDLYRQVLQSNGLEPAEYEARLRDGLARGLVQRAVTAGVEMPAAYEELLSEYLGERRRFTRAEVTPDMLDRPIPEPTEAQLETHHGENESAYTRPRTREVTYAWITPEMMADKVEISDEALRQAYERNSDRFDQPERRIVERLVFPDTAAAESARARIESGALGFDDLVAERGLSPADIDLGRVARGDLADDAAEAAFALDGPGVAGPAESELGPALFRVNAILPAQTTAFEQAAEQLRPELARDRARDRIDEMISPLEDDLAAGATLEELADSTAMELGRMDYTGAARSGPAGDPAFRRAAESTAPGDFPELIDLDSDGLAALRVEEVQEARLQPLGEVRGQVAEDWRAAERARRLGKRAEELAARLTAGATFEGLGLTTEAAGPVTRRELPAQALARAVFDTPAGQTASAALGDRAVVIRVDEVLPPQEGGQAAQLAGQLANQADRGMGGDMLSALTDAIVERAGVQLDQQAINAVHSQIGGGGGHNDMAQ